MSERIYDIDGKKLPSVTTILGILNKPALMPWCAKITAAEFRRLVEDGNTDLDEVEQLAKKAYRAKSKEAMDIGTKVHEAIQNFFDSNLTMKADEVQDEDARRGFEAFLLWGATHDVDIISYEQVVSDGETYAGRYDMLATVDGVLTLVDFKTSTGIWPEYWMQTAAYASCLQENVQAVAVLRIDKETGDIEYEERLDWFKHAEAFRLLAQFYKLNKTLK